MTKEPLSVTESRALEVIRSSVRPVATITVRELAAELGYSSVSMPQRLIETLERKGRISRDKRGVIEVL